MASKIKGSFFADQFSNPANPLAHKTSTAPEIWEQMDGKLDALVAGVGSGGTVTGLAEFFKEKNQDIQMIVADPE
jgi:cystathionine beta-synthase